MLWGEKEILWEKSFKWLIIVLGWKGSIRNRIVEMDLTKMKMYILIGKIKEENMMMKKMVNKTQWCGLVIKDKCKVMEIQIKILKTKKRV